MEQLRVAGVTGPKSSQPGSGTGSRAEAGSGYAVGGRLVLSSAHLTGAAGTRVKVFHPGAGGDAGGTVVWAGTPGGRDDAALVLVDDSPHWQPPTMPVVWGRPDTKRSGTPCETWGVPDEAQRTGRPVEAVQLGGELNPGSGIVGNQYVIDLRTPGLGWPGDGTSPWGGLSGAAVFCDRYLTGVVASDRANSAHGRLNVVPAYVLHHDDAFRTALAEHGGGPAGGLRAVEFQDIADPTIHAAVRRAPVTPAALLEAGRQTVPFHGREKLLADMQAWCGLGGFGAWLLHGPGGQGKTRLAHHLGKKLTAANWTVLWPHSNAETSQLLEVRRAAKPLLVVLDWWQQARRASRQAGEYLATARTRRLTPLEDDPHRRAGHYRDATLALALALPAVPDLAGHDWSTAAAGLQPPRRLGEDAYGNALTLHMTALADILDTTQADPTNRTDDEDEGAQDVEDRLLDHESRYWEGSATTRGLTTNLSINTLETALAAAHLAGAADRDQADLLWQRLPALADQPRDRRNTVTAWLTTLYPPPSTAPGGPPWGALQPDRLAERHIGRILDTDPAIAEHLINDADDAQTAQLLTVYSRAAAHPVFDGRLDTHLTDLCVRHHRKRAAHIITTATRTDHPTPLISALDTLATDPAIPLDTLHTLHGHFPRTSHRLATTAAHLTHTITGHYRTLAETNPDAHLPDLAGALNNLSVRLGEVGRRAEGLAAAEEAVGHYRTLAQTDPDAHLPDLAGALNNLSVDLGEVGRVAEGLAAVQEAVAIRRTLTKANPDAHLPNLAASLNNLSIDLSEVGRQTEGLTAAEEAVAIRRTLTETNPDAHLPNLASALNNLSIRLGEVGRRAEALTAAEEAVAIRRTLAETNPDLFGPALQQALEVANVLKELDP